MGAEIQNSVSTDAGLCMGGACRDGLKNGLALDKALGELKSAIPSERTLTPEAAKQLFGKLFGEEMGSTIANYIQEAGVETAKLTPTAKGFQVDIKLRDGVNVDVSDMAEKIIKEQQLSPENATALRGKIKDLGFEKIDIEDRIGMDVSIDSAKGTLNVKPLPGQDSLGIGFGKSALGFAPAVYSYAEEVTLSADGLRFNGTKGYESNQPFPQKDGVQVAAKGMMAFAESLSDV